jgi:enamine deaminase RidA (YjgF/YER057c/UK114 family)
MHRALQPEGWIRPAGYANGVVARGRTIFLAGQIGWNRENRFESDDLVAQIAQALRNIVSVLACDGAGPEHITSLAWYLIDKREYAARLKEVGKVYREVMGRNFPAMTALQVSALIEDKAKVEIQAIAVVPDGLEYVSSRPEDG